MFVLLLPCFAHAQRNPAACSGISNPGEWQDCVKRYEERERELRQDPRWQAEQERIRREEQLRLRELEELARIREQQQRQFQQQQRVPMDCTTKVWGGQLRTTCY